MMQTAANAGKEFEILLQDVRHRPGIEKMAKDTAAEVTKVKEAAEKLARMVQQQGQYMQRMQANLPAPATAPPEPDPPKQILLQTGPSNYIPWLMADPALLGRADLYEYMRHEISWKTGIPDNHLS